MTTPAPAEGWYADGCGRHEARWYSYGEPTALVRDGGVESHDPVGADEHDRCAIAVELVEQAAGPVDLRRADEADTAGPGSTREGAERAEAAAIWLGSID